MIWIICFTGETDGDTQLLFCDPAFAGKLLARVTIESRQQMTKGLLLIRMYEGN